MIYFTQYLRPNGQTKRVSIDLADDTEALASELTGISARFEIERLNTGQVSLECLIPESGLQEIQTLSSALCDNGPGITDVVDDLIQRAHATAHNRGLIA